MFLSTYKSISKFINRNSVLVFLFLSSLFFVSTWIVVSVVANHFAAKETDQVERSVIKHLSLVRTQFESAIFMDTYLADSLATVVIIDPQFALNNWDLIASKLMKKARFVRNIAVAPNNVISKVYPLAGNEGTLGFDFRNYPAQLRSILQAKQQQQVFIDGPLALIQGGIGLISRYPIFSDYPLNQEYWGTVSVVMDYQKLIEESGFYHVNGAKIALRKPASDQQTSEVFLGDASIFDQPDIEQPVILPNGQWQMAAKFQLDSSENVQQIRNAVNVAGYSVALVIYALLYLHFRDYRRIHKASLHDELTHLPNRRFVFSLLEQQMKSSELVRPFALLNIDLNDFKIVNDELGHQAGDELLKHVATQLLACVRHSDTVARFGGDEFVVVLQNVADTEGVNTVITKIRAALEGHHLMWEGHHIQPSLSIGHTVYTGQATDLKQLLSQADKAMYEQKNQFKQAQNKTLLNK